MKVSAPTREQRVSMSCGTSLNVTIWESENYSNINCVLLHGLDNHSRIWDTVAHELSRFANVYAPDFRGHGNSEWNATAHYNRARLVQDLDELFDYFEIENAIVIGHSLGGSIACSYAAKYPRSVTGLILCDIGLDTKENVIQSIASNAINRQLAFSSWDDFMGELQKTYFMADKALLEAFGGNSVRQLDGHLILKTDPSCIEEFANDLIKVSCISGQSDKAESILWNTLTRIDVPIMFLKGKFSSVLGLKSAQRATAFRNNRSLHVIDKAGHALLLDNSVQCIALMLDFIEQNISPEERDPDHGLFSAMS